jgi:hypothetical protein
MNCHYYIDRFPSHSTPETIVIITHHHHDHIQGKKKSFRGTILTSPMTHKLLSLPNTIPLPYYQVFDSTHITVQLIPNHHCAGSVGIVIFDKTLQQSIGYTGDFRIWNLTPQCVNFFLQHFTHCHTLYYDDSFQNHTSSSPIPTLQEAQDKLKSLVYQAKKPLYIHINRTGIEILFKSWMNELDVTFHESLSPAMKRVLPLLFPPETCRGSYPIVFCHDKKLADVIPECTACYMDECRQFRVCFHNTPQELGYFLQMVPKTVELKPCGYHIPLKKT